jgi:putative ABC transport system permease protein
MSLLDGLRHRLYVLRRGEAYSREVQRELDFHLELEHIALRRDSNERLDNEILARHALGNVAYYREEVRAMTVLRWLDRVRQDAGYAWRGLVRSPLFTATVVGTLGLGVGVNAAMYGFLDRVFVRPPAGVIAPHGVRRIYIQSPRVLTRSGRGVFGSFSYARFSTLAERFHDTIQVAGYSPSAGTLLKVGGALDSVRSSSVSPEYFSVLQLRPRIGRFFGLDESRIEFETPVVVISDALWRQSFARDPGVLGRVIELKRTRYTIIGVAPPGFTGVDINRVDIWRPLNSIGIEPRNGVPWYKGSGNYLRVIARLDSTAMRTRIVTAGTAALRNMAEDSRRDTAVTVLTGPLAEASGPADNEPAVTVSVRIGAVAFIVLLIACANVANMLLLRTSSRKREIAVRRALGVSTTRLYEQVITESVLLGLLSGVVALLFAIWAAAALRGLLLPTTHWSTAAVDGQVGIVTVVAAFAVGFVVGLFPAALASGVDLGEALKSSTRSPSRHRRIAAQSVLLVVQAALSVVLLVGAGLFVQSLMNVRAIDLGYDPDGLLVANTYSTDETRTKAVGVEFASVANRLRAMPGVVAVGLSSSSPMGGWEFSRLFVPGRDSSVKLSVAGAPAHFHTGPGFFTASGVAVLAGRDFNVDDRVGSAPVIIIDEQIARELWPGESALGKCLVVAKPTAGCSTVIGVVEAIHRTNVIEAVTANYYLPLAQAPDASPRAIVVRASGAALKPAVAAMNTEMRALLPDQADWSVKTMGQVLANDMRPWRMGAILFGGLGVLALIVAAIGIYGVVAYAMSQRKHEMGIRIALGAQVRDILSLVLVSGLRIVAIGVAIGLVAALMLGRLVASQLYGVAPSDASILVASAATMCALAAIASLVPGWRASRVDPVSSLRSE